MTFASSPSPRGVIGSIFFCLHLLGSALAGLSIQESRQLPGVWLTAATSFLLLSLAWRGVVPRPTRDLALIAAATVATTFAGLVLVGTPVGAAVWFSVGVLLHGIALAFSYRGLREAVGPSTHPSGNPWYPQWRADWFVRRPTDLLAFATAAVVASAVLTTWGTLPDRPIADDPEAMTLFFASYAVTALVAGPSLMLLMQRPRAVAQARNLVLLLALSAATSACVILALRSPELPLSWIVLVPALAAGSMLRPWAAAAHCLIQGSVALSYSQARVDLRTWEHPFATALMMTTLTGVIVTLTLTLSLIQRHRVRLAAALARQRQRAVDQEGLLRTVLTEMGDGVMLTDELGNLEFHNRAAESVMPHTSDNWVDTSIPPELSFIAAGGDRITDLPALRAHIAKGGSLQGLVVFESDPSRRRTLDVSHRAVRVRTERRVVTMFRDVTAQRQRENEIRELAREAANALQQPLATLRLGLSATLEEAARFRLDEVSDLLARAAAGGQRLAHIIEDWSGYSIDRSGELDLQVVSLDQEIANTAAGLHDGTELSEFSLNLSVTHKVHVDPGLLRQLLSNLLGNGLKYRRPDVRPRLHVRSSRERVGWIRVDVVDNGIGITPGDEVAIFQSFHRSAKVRDRFEGSGLGLATCRSIVIRHGGQIWARANASGGSTVSFTLPEAASQ